MNLNVKKLWYRWKGQKPQQKSPLQEIHALAKLHLYWGITPHENTQLQCRNMPEDIADILGTQAFQSYVEMPLQTLDGIIVNQPKRFLPLAKEAKRIAEEIRIEIRN